MLKEFLRNTFLNQSFSINQKLVLNIKTNFTSSVERSKLTN